MSENIVEVLIYLYENYMDGEHAPPPDQESLKDELVMAGFRQSEIEKAFNWLDELASNQAVPQYRLHTDRSIRVYTEREAECLDVEARGFLLFLEQNGIVDQLSRELVVERVMALHNHDISTEELKWVVLMVLMNRPGQEAAFAQMEEMVYNEAPAYLH